MTKQVVKKVLSKICQPEAQPGGNNGHHEFPNSRLYDDMKKKS